MRKKRRGKKHRTKIPKQYLDAVFENLDVAMYRCWEKQVEEQLEGMRQRLEKRP